MIIRQKNVYKLAGAIIFPQLAGAIGALFTVKTIPTWYAGLTKPVLNPPNWIFAPVWTSLYLLMGLAAFLVWRAGWQEEAVRKGMIVFAVQLVLNVLWTAIFFGAQNLGLAFIEIVILWGAILATMILFKRVSRFAVYLLVPYLLWVTFAAYLNFTLWVLN